MTSFVSMTLSVSYDYITVVTVICDIMLTLTLIS